MASTLIIYQGTGSQTDYTIPFDYLKKSFVNVSLEGEELTGGDSDDTGADYYFIDNTTIRLKVAPPAGQYLTIRRYTSQTQRVVTFKDASVLKANDLDTSQLQAFHIASEARDVINDALIQNNEDNWDAKNRRIVRVADPVDPQDAMTYGVYLQDSKKVQQNRDQSLQFRNQAQQFRDEAEQFKNQSSTSASNALTSQTNAKASGDKAKESQTNAKASQNAVEADRAQVQANTKDVATKHSDVVSKHSQVVSAHEDTVTKHSQVVSMHSDVSQWKDQVIQIGQPIAEIEPQIKIVANNIQHVVTDSNNIGHIQIVSSDLQGSLQVADIIDYGTLGQTSGGKPQITGGNIFIVAQNIEDIKRVGDLIQQGIVDDVINATQTVAALVTRAQTAESNTQSLYQKAQNIVTQGSTSISSLRDSAIQQISDKTDQVIAQGNAQVQKVTQQGTSQVNLAKAQVTKAAQQAKIGSTKASEASSSAAAASQSATNAKASQSASKTSQKNANTSETNAKTSETNAASSASSASASSQSARSSASAAASSASEAGRSANDAYRQAQRAKEYADQASAGQIQADWNQADSSQKDFIKNKPDLASVATSGSYNDLKDVPSIPTPTWSNLEGKPSTFPPSAHMHSISEITNLQETLNGKQPSGSYVTTEELNALSTKLEQRTKNIIDYGTIS